MDVGVQVRFAKQRRRWKAALGMRNVSGKTALKPAVHSDLLEVNR